jgi:D-aspartate ligase
VTRAARSRPSAVVVGLDNITGLQTARLLARRGLDVVGVAADPGHPACLTRECRRVVAAPASGPALLAILRQLSARLPGAVLFPCTDAAVATLAHGREEVGDLLVVLPSAEVVDTLMLKDRFAEHAATHGLPVPAGRHVTTIDDAGAVADQLTFPIVVKPPVKTPAWEATGDKVRRYDDPRSWLDAVPALLSTSASLHVQEWIPGGDEQLYSCNVYISPRGGPVRSFVARKLRQWPPHLGTSSLGEAVCDEAVRALAVRTLTTLPYVGLGYVEVKRDVRTGRHVVIEANVGRPTGRSAIAEAGGVELLLTMYLDAIGAELPSPVAQRDQTLRWMHVTRDLRAAAYYHRCGELGFQAWLASVRGPIVFADLDRHDLRPFLATVWRGLRRRGARAPAPATASRDETPSAALTP